MATTGNQKTLDLRFGTQSAPAPAPMKVVRQIESPAQALRVMVVASGAKLDYIGGVVGKSRSYLSRLQSGERPIPDKLVGPLCAACGSDLLRQYLALEAALSAPDDVLRLAAMLRAA